MIRRKDARQRAMKIAALIMSAALSFCLVFGFVFAPAGVSDAAESGVSLSLPEGYLEAVGGDAEDAVTDLLGIPEAVLLVRELLDGADTAALKSDPVVIAVIDTGVQTGHEVFGTGTAENVFLTKSGNIVARNTLNNTSDVRDGASKDYHGTHVTGIAARQRSLLHTLHYALKYCRHGETQTVSRLSQHFFHTLELVLVYQPA